MLLLQILTVSINECQYTLTTIFVSPFVVLLSRFLLFAIPAHAFVYYIPRAHNRSHQRNANPPNPREGTSKQMLSSHQLQPTAGSSANEGREIRDIRILSPLRL